MWNFNLKSSVHWTFKSKLQCKTSIWKVQCIELSNQNFSVKLQCIELSHQNFSVHWTFTSKLQCKTSMHWTFKLNFNALNFWHWSFDMKVQCTELFRLKFSEQSYHTFSFAKTLSDWVAGPATLTRASEWLEWSSHSATQSLRVAEWLLQPLWQTAERQNVSVGGE